MAPVLIARAALGKDENNKKLDDSQEQVGIGAAHDQSPEDQDKTAKTMEAKRTLSRKLLAQEHNRLPRLAMRRIPMDVDADGLSKQLGALQLQEPFKVSSLQIKPQNSLTSSRIWHHFASRLQRARGTSRPNMTPGESALRLRRRMIEAQKLRSSTRKSRIPDRWVLENRWQGLWLPIRLLLLEGTDVVRIRGYSTAGYQCP